MDFMTAVRTCFAKYVGFSGRARRSEFWYFVLFTFLVGIVTSILDSILGTDYDGNTSGGLINTLGSLALFLPSLAVAIRRLHDINRSGWWILLGIIPIVGWIIVIVWYCTDTKPGDNQYGPDPKNGPTGAYPPPPPAEPYGTGQYGG
ncbi:Uncharacterized membrane protein YhaH, DUF805 family [Nocardioides alpinus]|uniref:DUF805 domain-containing protein n=1 Tax=Nocardioides alpinus TaxID=748909 RepID=A0A1I0ZRY0_9ACTN|nr:DUF805 domain-containing protein [Nocardioides alpinus]PKH41927.1 DUF805 domain-containing protein [Nocardioides alpinus]SFB26913.1 Uncharacterized membrane protein YhaH, DUF805 family [Nocardioides alpinus]